MKSCTCLFKSRNSLYSGPVLRALVAPRATRAAISAAYRRTRLARGALPAHRTDSHSRLCLARPARKTCTSAQKSTFSPLTPRREAFAVSSSAPHARAARWAHPTRRSDCRNAAHAREPHTRLTAHERGTARAAPRRESVELSSILRLTFAELSCIHEPETS